MSPASSQAPSPADRNRRTGDRRPRKIVARTRARRKARWRGVEALEPRTLLATLPAIQLDPQFPATVDGLDTLRDISRAGNEYESQPTVAVSPANPQRLVAVWQVYNPNDATTPYQVRGAYSNDGGLNWGNFSVQPEGVLSIFPTSLPVAFPVVSDITATFDGNGYLYIAESEHSTDLSNGAIVAASYDFNGVAPSLVSSQTVQVWNQSDQNFSDKSIRKPQIVADSTRATFVDPTTGQVRTNPGAGNVYLAWGTDVPPPPTPPTPWNRNTVELLASPASGGGANPLTFGGPNTVGSGHVSLSHDAAPRISVSQGNSGSGTQAGQVTVVFDDFGGGRTNSPPVDLIRVASLRPPGRRHDRGDRRAQTVDSTTVLGAATSPYPLVTASNPQGIGPAPVIASDNTSGTASPNAGRLYIAYVDRYDSHPLPHDRGPQPGRQHRHLRPLLRQRRRHLEPDELHRLRLLPHEAPRQRRQRVPGRLLRGHQRPEPVPDLYHRSAAVRAGTGRGPGDRHGRPELSRHPLRRGPGPDGRLGRRGPARRLRTRSLSSARRTSSTLPSAPTTSPAARTSPWPRSPTTPRPRPTRASPTSAASATTPAWPTTTAGSTRPGPATSTAAIRVTTTTDSSTSAWPSPTAPSALGSSASTMGPVEVHHRRWRHLQRPATAQGVPILDGFVVTFDRGVDPSTFGIGDVTVTSRSPSTSGSQAGVPVSVLSVTPLNASATGATQFLVRVPDQTNTGTYSYTIGPDVRAMLGGTAMDQNGDGRPGQADDVYQVPTTGDDTTLPLMIGGPKVVRTFVLADDDRNPATPPVPTTTADNRVTDQSVSAVYVVFSRDMDPTTFDASDILSATGPLAYRLDPATGQTVLTTRLFGPFTVTPAPIADPNNPDPDPDHPRTYQISFPAETLSGTYAFTIGPQVQSAVTAGHDLLDSNQNAGLARLREEASSPEELVTRTYTQSNATTIGGGAAGDTYSATLHVPDNFQVKDVNLTLNIQYPRDSDLEAWLYSPDPTKSPVPLFSTLKNTAPFANFTNTTLDDSATTPIQNGGPPFNGRFNPRQPLADLNDVESAGDWRLEITVNAAGTVGKVLNWTLQLQQALPTDGLGEPVADRANAAFRIFTMDPTMAQSSQTWTAVGPAGVDARAARRQRRGRRPRQRHGPRPVRPLGQHRLHRQRLGRDLEDDQLPHHRPGRPDLRPLDRQRRLGRHEHQLDRRLRPQRRPRPVGHLRRHRRRRRARRPEPGRPDQPGPGHPPLDGRRPDLGAARQHRQQPAVRPARPRLRLGARPGRRQLLQGRRRSDPHAQRRRHRLCRRRRYRRQWALHTHGHQGGLLPEPRLRPDLAADGAGQATDIVLDPHSADAVTGNLRFLYAAFAGDGVYFSPNRGQNFNLMAGTTGDPLIQLADLAQPQPIAVNQVDTPNGKPGRIVLAKPALTGDPLKDGIYAGWLYAAVVGPTSDPLGGTENLVGVYLTKDFGQTWTKLHLPAVFDTAHVPYLSLPANDPTLPDIDPTGRTTPAGTAWHLGDFDISLAVDPNNPNVIYVGANSQFQDTGLIRIDTTGVHDSKAFYLDNRDPDGGLRRTFVTADPITGSAVSLVVPTRGATPANGRPPYDPISEPYLNLIRDPNNPFVADATILVTNTAQFSNSGAQVRWTQFDQALKPDIYATANDPTFDSPVDPWGRPARGVHQILTVRDPLTGANRMIFSTNQGVYTAVDKGDGTLVGSIGGQPTLDTDAGNTPVVQGSRNGNLQIAQMNYGAAQPSFLAAQLAALQGFLYGSAENIGSPMSDPGLLDPNSAGYGNLSWQGGFDLSPVPDRNSTRGAVAVQQEIDTVGGQPQGGTVYYWRPSEALVEVTNADQPANNQWPANDGRPSTDTFQVNGTAYTFGLYQTSNPGNVVDSQWPYRQGFNFAVNPLSGNQILISSAAGRVFKTDDRGLVWAEVGNPGALDSTNAQALAYGAPDPNGPAGGKVLDNFLYAGTAGGHIFVTFTGGGGNGNSWLPLSNGLDGSPIQTIIPDPTRGNYDAFAVTQQGVYYNPDAKGGADWRNITGNLFSIAHGPLANGGDNGTENLLQTLTALQVDWRYVIPDDFADPNGPTHPVLYVSGDSGVYRSFDKGTTWNRFPEDASTNLLDSPTPGGGLPNVRVTDLDLSLGNVDPTTGRPDTAGGANVLVATTYGRGQFAIRLAPMVLPNQAGVAPVLHLASDTESDTGLSQTDGITRNRAPYVVGYSEQTAFGNDVTIRLIDQTPDSPTFGQVVGVGKTDEFGRFLTINPDGSLHAGIRIQKVDADGNPVYDSDGNPVPADLMTFDGKKTLGVQATNASGTQGNIAVVGDGTLTTIELDTTPPDPAQLPDLQDGSDTGPNNADEITNPNIVAAANAGKLLFTITFGASEVNTQATLYRDNVAVGQPASGTGSAVVTDPGPISPDGDYAYKVQLTDQAGNASPDSPVLNVRVDTQAPAQPDQPTLDPNNPVGGSDSGLVGDGITNVRQPFFSGNAEPNTLANPNAPSTTQQNVVTLLDQFNTVYGTSTVQPDGTYSVQPSTPLTDRAYSFHVRVTDLAGNDSADSDPIAVTVQSATPPTPTLQMVLTDDSGLPGDNITNVTRPHFQGAHARAGLTVQIVDVNGLITGTPGALVPPGAGATPIIVANDGTFSFQFPQPLDDNQPGQKYRIAARTIDIAGNYADSAPLDFQILTAGPSDSPVIGLLAADDTGTKGDNVTSLRQVQISGTGATPGVTVVLLPVGVVPSPDKELAQTTADAGGHFILQPPNQLQNGTLTVVAREVDAAGNYGPASRALVHGQAVNGPLGIRLVTTPGDYNADGRADLASFNRDTGAISLGITGGGNTTGSVGVAGAKTIPLQGDFDGDGKTDYGVVDARTNTWTIQRSQLGRFTLQFGWPGVDLPLTGDFDGDGKTDIGVFRPTNATYYVLLSGGGVLIQQFGQPNRDRPLLGDFDGDGKTDLLIYRPDTSQFIGRLSGGSVLIQQFGWPGVDVPVAADFDGDGKTDVGVYRPTNATFYALLSGGGGALIQTVGSPGGIPVPQDYDNDGKADPTVFNPSTGQWTIRQSSNNTTINRALGSPGDVPLGAPLEPYRLPAGTSPIGRASFNILAASTSRVTTKTVTTAVATATVATVAPSVASPANNATVTVAAVAPTTTAAPTTAPGLGLGRNAWRQEVLLRLAAIRQSRLTTLPAQATPSALLALGFGRRLRG